MNLYNNKITYRLNMLFRNIFILPKLRRRIKNKNATIICNNCNAGFILHDLQMKFNTPTINMYFKGTDFFDFVENLDYYLKQDLLFKKTNLVDNNISYPICTLKGNDVLRDLELHFLHYSDYESAKSKWNTRKKRIDKNNIFIMWTFMGKMDENGNEYYYNRVKNFPFENKVCFVNHPVEIKDYPDFFYIKGFEKEDGLGVLSLFQGLNGRKYYV